MTSPALSVASAPLGVTVFTDVCVLFYLREEKAWKSLARLISE